MYVDIKWIKLAVNWYKDDSIRLIRKLPAGNDIALMFVMLLGMAGELNKGGYIPYTSEDLSNLLDIELSTVELGLKAMIHKGLLEEVDGMLHITNWEKWQTVENFDRLKIQRREATRRWRERKALEPGEIPALPAPDKQETEPRQTAAERRFELFWKAYPKKVGKGAAEKSFGKFKPDDALTERMLRAIEAQRSTRQWKEGYIPNPATWLNQRRWEDEVETDLPFSDPNEPAYIRDESIEDWN